MRESSAGADDVLGSRSGLKRNVGMPATACDDRVLVLKEIWRLQETQASEKAMRSSELRTHPSLSGTLEIFPTGSPFSPSS